MSKSDLVTKKTVLDTLEQLFTKYHVAFKPEGNLDSFGFGSEVPQAINNLDPDYDVDKVLTDLSVGQSLLVPHRGYCINKDIAKQIIEDGWKIQPEYGSPDDFKEDVANAIYFIKRFNFCGACDNRHCDECGRYNAKKYALIALDFYSHISDIFTKLDELQDKAKSDEERDRYGEIQKLIDRIHDHSMDCYL